jgi:hypothetical protein
VSEELCVKRMLEGKKGAMVRAHKYMIKQYILGSTGHSVLPEYRVYGAK